MSMIIDMIKFKGRYVSVQALKNRISIILYGKDRKKKKEVVDRGVIISKHT